MQNHSQLTAGERVKAGLWRAIYPVFPWIQDHLLRWHILWHEKGRQPYHLGYLAPGKTLQDLEKHLSEQWGFGNHFVAWHDRGQVLSWRKLVSFSHQYHIRVFADGEIRGHYEYTPEAKPVAHFAEMGEEERKAQFKKFLGDYCVEHKTKMHLEQDRSATATSEITVDGVLKQGR